LQLIANLRLFAGLNRPLLLGASRKSVIGGITGKEVHNRLAGSLAVAGFAMENGVNILRVHDVAETTDVINVIHSLQKEKNISAVSE
jgi:dihydropteroate synthase